MSPHVAELLRLALIELVDRRGGEVILDAEELQSKGRALQFLSAPEGLPPRLLLRVVTQERADELIQQGAPQEGGT